MSLTPRVLAAVLLIANALPARAAEPPADIAALFPDDTLAYAELANPAELAPELVALFKGTALQDGLSLLHARKDKAGSLLELNGKDRLATLALLTSPEWMDEFKRIRIAVALTGFSAQGEPEFVLVVITHNSPSVGLAARAYLTMTPTIRRVGEVAGVPFFQHRNPNITFDDNGVQMINKEQPPTEGPSELTYLYTPGLFAIGTNKNAVGGALQRFNGQEKKANLADNTLFKDAATAHRKTGLFYFVDFPRFCTKLDDANKARGALRGIAELIGIESDIDPLALFKFTANAKAVKSVAGSVRFREGGLSVIMAAQFDSAQPSPLFDFLSGPGVKLELLHPARKPAVFALGVSFPEKNRAGSVIALLDGVAKANGEIGRLPGEAIREMERKYKVAVSEQLIGKTRAATLIMPTTQAVPKGASVLPMLVLHAEDAASATAWEEFLPKLITDLAGAANPIQPSSETINGVKVFSLPGNELRWKSPVHYARSGVLLVVGLDQKLVASAIAKDPMISVVGGDQPIPPPPADAAAFGVVSVGEWLSRLLEQPPPDGAVVIREPRLMGPNGNPLPQSFSDDLKKARKALIDSFGTLRPATLTVTRAGNELRMELFQPSVQAGGLKAVIDAGVNWLDLNNALTGSRFNKH